MSGVNILSIQSHVAYGHVGNSAALFALQRLGCEAWAVHTVQFSNHTGYGDWKGQVFTPEHVRDVVAGIAARGVFPQCHAVLSGYVGAAELGDVILDAVKRVKAANPSAIYACDPAMGSREAGFFARKGVPEFVRDKLLPVCDVMVLNQFEAGWLTGLETETLGGARSAAAELHRRGPATVVVNGIDAAPDRIASLALGPEGTFVCSAPKVALRANGAGDMFAAIFLALYLRGRAISPALSGAVSALYAVIRKTAEIGAQELALIAAQDELVRPRERFPAERLG
jgi:pyridoxine kinase